MLAARFSLDLCPDRSGQLELECFCVSVCPMFDAPNDAAAQRLRLRLASRSRLHEWLFRDLGKQTSAALRAFSCPWPLAP